MESTRCLVGVSLIGLLTAGGILLFVSGPAMFWIFGLILTLFVGRGGR